MNAKAFLFAFLIALCAASAPALAQSPASTVVVSSTKATPDAELRRQSFEKVWTTINEKHFDPTFNGVDWQRVRAEYEPKALAAKDNAELHRILQRMLDELKQSHFSIIPIGAASDSAKNESLETTRGTIGIKLMVIDGRPVVTRVKADSPAARAGIKTGFIIEKINSRSVAEILQPIERRFAANKPGRFEEILTRQAVLLAAVNSRPKTTVQLEILDGADKARTIAVESVADTSEMSPPLGNMPASPLEFETKRLENGVGYIRFNVWLIAQMPRVKAAIREMADAPGIIFDLRDNPGGLVIMASGIAGNLFQESASLGTTRSRTNTQKLVVYPQLNSFTNKVVVLTNGGSASTSEIFAAGMQETKRARVVGERSAGAILTSLIERLPTGALFQYALSDYKSPQDVLIEGRGVEPDETVKLTRESLLAGRDSQVDAAVNYILSPSKK